MSNQDRRTFLKKAALATGGLAIAASTPSFIWNTEKYNFKLSLAQWSLHKSLFAGKITTLDFPTITKNKYGIEAVEYVSQFFYDKAKDTAYLNDLKGRCSDSDVKSLLIMVDNEGSLADTTKSLRDKAVENHYKWVEAANYLGCHSIRVNLHGEGTENEWKEASIDSLSKLVNFGADHGVNIIVENHGQWSSKGYLLAEVIKQVDHKYCGTLPDFGNFCVRRRDGDLWVSPCVEEYDKYKGVQELLPFAKGVSAKTFAFDDEGNETTIDFLKMMKLVKNSGYKGYVGIEFEGNKHISEEDGILKTKALLEKVKKQL